MACQNPGCVRQYAYERVAHYARKRYVEGNATIVLLCEAQSDAEKKLVVLASLLDVDDDNFRELMLSCNPRCQGRMFELRERLRTMIEVERCRRRAA